MGELTILGGSEFHSLIVDGKIRKFKTVNSSVKLVDVACSQEGWDRNQTIMWYTDKIINYFIHHF